MERNEPTQGSSSYEYYDQPGLLHPQYVDMPGMTEELDAYSAGHRNGVLSGILLGSISGALTVLILWFLFL